MGWALKSSSRKVRYSAKQKNFLDLKFNLGEQSGKKSSGDEVAQQMRRARGRDDSRLFSVDEFLEPQAKNSLSADCHGETHLFSYNNGLLGLGH